MSEPHSLSGTLTPDGHVLIQRVYYEDTDFSGLVYHARYLHFLERGRTDMLRCLGIDQVALYSAEGDGLAFVVHRMEIDFKASARMDDVLEITTRRTGVAGARILLEQEIRCGGRLLIAAQVTIVSISRAGRPRKPPAALAN